MKTHKEWPVPRFIAGGTRHVLEGVNHWLHRIFATIKPEVDALFAAMTAKVEMEHLPDRFANPPLGSWVVTQSADAVERVGNLNADVKKIGSLRKAAQWLLLVPSPLSAHGASAPLLYAPPTTTII